jgi:class 3 adenylate cyclase
MTRPSPGAGPQTPDRRRGISFRTKLLVSFVATVGLLGFASLAVVRLQTERQIDWTIQRTTERAQRALTELERFRRAELERLAQRITGSIRIVAALEAALVDADVESFVQDVQYELTLAQFNAGLVAFHDPAGRPVLTLLNGARVANVATEEALAREVARTGVVSGGYYVLDPALFAVQRHRLELFGATIGTVTLGFPLDAEMAARLGEIVGADICFAAAGRCLVGTPGLAQGALAARAVEAARADGAVRETIEGRRIAIVAPPLPATANVASIIAVPLDEVLRPFDRIHQVERIAAASALALAVVLGLVLSTSLTTPIRTLVAATRRIARGEYDFRVEVRSRDELGNLADAFNHMTDGLQLKERYRGVLDKVVSPDVADELMKGELRLGGERREISTLFADVRGFTTLSGAMAPEDVVRMLNAWFEVAGAAIEEHGGVLDKYVGDEVMAIFGAPLAQHDHAIRAVRAGLRLRELTEQLQRERVGRNLPSFAIGIGVASGSAVAGNVGSANRMNYTVLGASVNLASRLCSQAGPGEILVAETTYAAVSELVEATAATPRIPKGFSQPMTPYAIHGYRSGEHTAGRVVSRAVSVLLLLVCTGTNAQSQVLDFPTLEELGWRFVSAGGLVQIDPSLRIDVDGYFPDAAPARHLEDTSAFAAGTGRLFVDLFVGQRVYASTELRVDRGQPVRAGPWHGHVQQAFARVMVSRRGSLQVQAGKFISPFGNYPQRAHAADDPFVRPPLLYDYRTVMQAARVPAASDGVFTWKDNPEFRSTGLPVVWDTPYPVAVAGTARGSRWQLTAGVTTTAPSAEPSDWDRLKPRPPGGLSLVARASYQVLPELGIGTSFSRGSYLGPGLSNAGAPVPRQTQDARGVEAVFRRSHLAIHSELVFNRWDVFRVADPARDVSYYVEARQTLAPGVFVAGRYGGIHFRDLARAAGGAGRWDYDVRRWQVGAGYRLGRSSEVRGEYMINRTLAATDPDDNLLALRWSITL